jgi:ParB family chromosome partitioning protein
MVANVNTRPSDDSRVVVLEIEWLKPPLLRLRPISDESVSELMRSIQNIGLLQPIMVRVSDDGYQVVFGNHRIEACRRLGMKRIPAIVNYFTNEEAFLARVTENLLRNAYVNPIEEAEGYRMLVNKGWTINAIARKIGKCDSYICERLAILENLDPRLRERVSNGSKYLTPSHAELLSRIPDEHLQIEVAKLIESRKLSVRTLENLLNGFPLPTRVQVEGEPRKCCIHIPGGFSNALGLKPGQTLCMYIRGRKLVLEARKAGRKNRQLSARNKPTRLLAQALQGTS